MKWIGQHIWDFISRFRSDVYLENVAESTQDHVVGIDADGKLYKQDVSTGDITGVTITTDSGGGGVASDTSGSADFSILGAHGVGVTNSGPTITAVAVPGEIDHDALINFVAAEHYRWDTDISSTATINTENITDLHGAGVDGADNQLLTDDGSGKIVSESGLTWTSDYLSATSSSSGLPAIGLANSNADAEPPRIEFRREARGSDDDSIGHVIFYSDNVADEPTSFASIKASVETAADTDEAGKLSLTVATSDGSNSSLRTALEATGHGTNATVDVDLGFGATSTTAIAGGFSALNGGLTCANDSFKIVSSVTAKPTITLENSHTDANPPFFRFYKSTTGTNDDALGRIEFHGQSAGGSARTFANIIGEIKEAGAGTEAGTLKFNVAENDGTLTTGLKLDGQPSDDGEVDVTIGAGTASVATIAGNLSVNKITTTHDYDTITFENQLGDNKGSGEILRYGSAQAGAIGTLHFLHTDGSWDATDSDDVATGGDQLLGIAVSTDPGANGMLLKGYYQVASGNIEGTPAMGKAVYVSEEPGKFDFTAPSGTTDFIRVVGYCIDIDSHDILLYFNPDNTWVKHA